MSPWKDRRLCGDRIYSLDMANENDSGVEGSEQENVLDDEADHSSKVSRLTQLIYYSSETDVNGSASHAHKLLTTREGLYRRPDSSI